MALLKALSSLDNILIFEYVQKRISVYNFPKANDTRQRNILTAVNLKKERQ
jgi:hypothetical protein